MSTVSYDIHALDDPFYRSRDGKPMSDNTEQFDWIVALQGALKTWYRDNPDVLVVGNLLWYPVEGDNKTRMAPDAMVVFGRPRGPRGSYIQYREEGVSPQVVFEVLSPGNRRAEMIRKREFYERYGVEEYYILNPFRDRHSGYVRDEAGNLSPIAELFGWVSPLLGIRFEVRRELRILLPDGTSIETHTEVTIDRDVARLKAEEERRRAEAEHRRADEERRRAEEQHNRAEAERQRNERLRAQLRAAGIEPED